MQLNWKHGKKIKNDRLITVTTMEEEPFSIFKLATLANQIALNESNIRDTILDITGNVPENLFRGAIVEAIEMGDAGINWGDEKYLKEVRDWCQKHKLKFERIEPELRRIQKSLKEFV